MLFSNLSRALSSGAPRVVTSSHIEDKMTMASATSQVLAR